MHTRDNTYMFCFISMLKYLYKSLIRQVSFWFFLQEHQEMVGGLRFHPFSRLSCFNSDFDIHSLSIATFYFPTIVFYVYKHILNILKYN